MLRVIFHSHVAHSHNGSPPHPLAERQWASPRAPPLLAAVGPSTQSPVPRRMSKVPSVLLPAPARSPLVLLFRHRRRLRLLDPSLVLFEARAPSALAAPLPQPDSINSPRSPRRGRFQPPGPAGKANPRRTPPPGPHTTQSSACASLGPAL